MTSTFNGCTALKTITFTSMPSVTNLNQAFKYCNVLETINNLDTSTVTNLSQAFSGCEKLSFPVLNLASVTNLELAFTGTLTRFGTGISSQSVYNIIESLKTATSYSGTKTMAYVGFNTSYDAVTNLITSQSNWDDLVALGWSLGTW